MNWLVGEHPLLHLLAPASDVDWLVCALRSGEVLEEMPLDPGGTITRRMAFEQQQTFTLSPLDPACPDDWAATLVPGYAMVVAVRDDQPVQGWAVDDWTPGAATIPVSTSALETCLARVNVPDLDAGGLDLSEALARLLAPLVSGFGFVVEWTPCGVLSTDLYDALEDRSVLDAANAAMAIDGGPEWRIVLRWADATRSHVQKVIEIGPRIGVRRPDVVLDLATDGSGTIATYSRPTSFATGKGAIIVTGVSEGSGSARPMTDPIVSDKALQGWPLWEERINFSGLDSDLVDDLDAALLDKTQRAAAQREQGGTSWKLSLRPGTYRPGTDFAEGDTLPLDVAPQGLLDPTGGSGDVRVIGWTEDPRSGAVDLILLDDDGTGA